MNYNNKKKLNHFFQQRGSGLHNIVCRYILAVYFFIMAVIYPFYVPGGYVRIGEVKYLFFRNTTLVTLMAAGGVILLSALIHHDREWIVKHYREMSVTDWLVYGYCLTVMVSYLCSAYKENALWGAEGWYMGTMSQLMFALLYFFFSRYYFYSPAGSDPDGENSGVRTAAKRGLKWLGLWLAAAAGVFLLGICNRYSFYPIAMDGQTETFISTLGNINWFCGYWSVAATVGITIYWCSEKKIVRVWTGIYSFIAMLSGITQGSSSAYLVFLALLVTLLVLSMQSNRKLYRFLELCMFFAAACLTGKMLQYLPGFSYNYWGSSAETVSGITASLLTGDAAAWLFLLLAGCYVLFRVLEGYGWFHIERYRWLQGVMAAAVAAAVCAAVLLFMIDSRIIYFREVPFAMERDSCLEAVLDEDWGNGRGATWKCGIDAYRCMDTLHKAVGAGPDCFADYVYDVPELAKRMIERFGSLRLTNAHNEWMTVLVNTGALGLFCYVGIFLAAFVRFLRKAGEQPFLAVFALAVLAYTVHNMVSFQQVLSTPYIFIVMGMGEGLMRIFKRNNGENTVEQ